MIAIHAEMTAVENGTADAKNNLLKNAPHTADQIASDNWNRPYSREQAAFPAKRFARLQILAARQPRGQRLRRPQPGLFLRGDGELFVTMNLFSKFQNKNKYPNSLTYELPAGLRVQIVRLWEKGFGPDERFHPGPGIAYDKIHQILCEEHQMLQLPQVSRQSLPLCGIIAEYFMNLQDTDKSLDVIQVVFSVMENMLHRIHDHSGDAFYKSRYQSSEIIDELNRRFEENKVGYRYVQGRIEKIPQGPEPMPLKERLVAGEPATNLRKINDLIGSCTVTAIHDPYTTTGSLDTILKLAGMGAKFRSFSSHFGHGKTAIEFHGEKIPSSAFLRTSTLKIKPRGKSEFTLRQRNHTADFWFSTTEAL